VYTGIWGWTKLVESGSADDGSGVLIKCGRRESTGDHITTCTRLAMSAGGVVCNGPVFAGAWINAV